MYSQWQTYSCCSRYLLCDLCDLVERWLETWGRERSHGLSKQNDFSLRHSNFWVCPKRRIPPSGVLSEEPLVASSSQQCGGTGTRWGSEDQVPVLALPLSTLVTETKPLRLPKHRLPHLWKRVIQQKFQWELKPTMCVNSWDYSRVIYIYFICYVY